MDDDIFIEGLDLKRLEQCEKERLCLQRERKRSHMLHFKMDMRINQWFYERIQIGGHSESE